MNTNENILEQLKGLQLGPSWDLNESPRQTEKNRSEEKFHDNRKKRVPRTPKKDYPQKLTILPDVTVSFRPQEAALQALVCSLKESSKTYQLFSISHLFLEKPERFSITLGYKERDNSEKGFYFALPEHLPFLTEEEAFQYAFKAHMAEYFNPVTITIEKPKGNFQYINQCGLTGTLLGPPNYHRYTELAREHFARNLENKYTFEGFQRAIKPQKDPEVINQWLEQMCTVTHYKLKEDNGTIFESQDAVRRYAYTNHKAKWVKFVHAAKVPGTILADMPSGALKQTIEAILEREKRFPLETANFLRGRFHHFGFHLYKKGKKGVSFVCAVKRKIRDQNTQLSASTQALIEFIEKNPNVFVGDLAKKYLNLDNNLSPDDLVANDAFKQLPSDLRWLVAEGYVIEYEDGRLYVMPEQNNTTKSDTVKNVSENVKDDINDHVPLPEILQEEAEGNK